MTWRVLGCAGTLKEGCPGKLTEDMGCGNEKTVNKYFFNTPSGCCYLTFCYNNWMPPSGKLIKSKRWFSPCSGGWKVQEHGAKYLTDVIYVMESCNVVPNLAQTLAWALFFIRRLSWRVQPHDLINSWSLQSIYIQIQLTYKFEGLVSNYKYLQHTS